MKKLRAKEVWGQGHKGVKRDGDEDGADKYMHCTDEQNSVAIHWATYVPQELCIAIYHGDI